jgi:hypothetical protein
MTSFAGLPQLAMLRKRCITSVARSFIRLAWSATMRSTPCCGLYGSPEARARVPPPPRFLGPCPNPAQHLLLLRQHQNPTALVPQALAQPVMDLLPQVICCEGSTTRQLQLAAWSRSAPRHRHHVACTDCEENGAKTTFRYEGPDVAVANQDRSTPSPPPPLSCTLSASACTMSVTQ